MYQSNLLSAFELYLSAITWLKPQNEKLLEYRLHDLIQQLVKAHHVKLSIELELNAIVKDLDSFIRQLKVEFDCMYVDLKS